MSHGIRIGVSGFRYPGWRGAFYPEGLPQRDELRFASRRFNSIELNGSFYSLQTPASYRRFREQTPEDFVLALKGSRYITHMKKLRDVRTALANFFASGVLCLGPKLGPILWQLPASLRCDELRRFEDFFELLPRDTDAARALAAEHSAWLPKDARVVDVHGPKRPLRHAVEARAPSCATAAFLRCLRKHRIACVVADTAGRWPYVEDVTSDFVYVRLHGDAVMYESGYTAEALARWAERIRAWHEGGEPPDARRVLDRAAPARRTRDVYVYFDNDVKAHAPFDAAALAARLGIDSCEAEADDGAVTPQRRPTA